MPQSTSKSLTGGMGDSFDLQPDERNLEAVLFPSNALRNGDISSRSINKYWEAVPIGEMDTLQKRLTIYQSLLNINGSSIFQDLKG